MNAGLYPELAAMAIRWNAEKRKEMAEMFREWAKQLEASANEIEQGESPDRSHWN